MSPFFYCVYRFVSVYRFRSLSYCYCPFGKYAYNCRWSFFCVLVLRGCFFWVGFWSCVLVLSLSSLAELGFCCLLWGVDFALVLRAVVALVFCSMDCFTAVVWSLFLQVFYSFCLCRCNEWSANVRSFMFARWRILCRLVCQWGPGAVCTRALCLSPVFFYFAGCWDSQVLGPILTYFGCSVYFQAFYPLCTVLCMLFVSIFSACFSTLALLCRWLLSVFFFGTCCCFFEP